ncbi:hypothetical protein [Actinomadura miaoliensis]|uniref:Uncharacterized protein n=1 Tax=Actinomadura miaoliensis TaxID=430685 RepID=A0ABP7W7E2_9ACTN
MKHKIRTTMRPHTVTEVGDAELLDLQRQGLIADVTDQASGTQAQPPHPQAMTTARPDIPARSTRRKRDSQEAE